MMIDTSPWSSCSCQSPLLPCSGHTISSTGPRVSPFREGSLVALFMFLLAIMVMMITMAVTCQVFLADDKWVAPPLLQMVSPSLHCPVSQTGITNLKPTSPNDSFLEIIHQSQGNSVPHNDSSPKAN